MPACPLSFRAVCGRFVPVFVNFMYKRVVLYRQSRVNTVKLGSLRLSFAVVFIIATLLIRSGDVELNPGPRHNEGRQSRLQSSGTRRRSADNSSTPAPDTAETLEQEPSLKDVMALLTGMRTDFDRRFDTINEHFDTLNNSVSGLREEMTQLAQEVEEVRTENEHLKADNHELKNRLGEAEAKLDDLEGRSKRNNLIFTGLKKQTDSDFESWDDCEKLVTDLIHNKLKISDDMEFDRVHRLRRDENSPIIARFASFKDKQKVLKAKRKLSETENGNTIFIGEDFSKRVRETRKKLVPFLKEAKKDKDKRATMVYDHLVINGKKFYYDEASNALKDSK